MPAALSQCECGQFPPPRQAMVSGAPALSVLPTYTAGGAIPWTPSCRQHPSFDMTNFCEVVPSAFAQARSALVLQVGHLPGTPAADDHDRQRGLQRPAGPHRCRGEPCCIVLTLFLSLVTIRSPL